MPPVRVTFFLEVLSSWCHWAEPTWQQLKTSYGDRVHFEWKIALMDTEAFPKSQEQCDGYYRRSEAVRKSDYRLNSGWFEFGQGQFLSASLMALAAKQMGVSDDSARLALTHAALRVGRKIGRWEIAAEVISETHGLPVTELLMWARSPEILREAQ